MSVSNEIRIELSQALANEERVQHVCEDLRRQKDQILQEKELVSIGLEHSKGEVDRLKAIVQILLLATRMIDVDILGRMRKLK